MMHNRILGNTGIRTSDVSMGCWPIGGLSHNLGKGIGWGGVDDYSAKQALIAAYDIGANYFDTADVYGLGKSERLLGTLIEEVSRSNIIIGSKVGYFRGTSPHAFHPTNMRHQLETSLLNLKTEYLDIYDFHNLNFGEKNEFRDIAVETMLRFKEEGKIRFIGIRFAYPYSSQFSKFIELMKPDIIKMHFNLLSQLDLEDNFNIFKWVEHNNIGVVFSKPFEQGVLLKKYDPAKPPIFEQGDVRQGNKWFSSPYIRIINSSLTLLQSRFGMGTQDLIRICCQYCLYNYKKATVLCGFKTTEQALMNYSANLKDFSSEEIEEIKSTLRHLHLGIEKLNMEKSNL